MLKHALAICGSLVVSMPAAAQVGRAPATPPVRPAERTVVCGLTVLPVDPKVDPSMTRPAPTGQFTLRTVTPSTCRAFATRRTELPLRLPTILGPKR